MGTLGPLLILVYQKGDWYSVYMNTERRAEHEMKRGMYNDREEKRDKSTDGERSGTPSQ